MGSSQVIKLLLLLAVAVAFVAGGYMAYNKKGAPVSLPYFGPSGKDSTARATYYQVPSFQFTNQLGDTTSYRDFSNSIYVTDFFFTTCGGICPIMTKQMLRVYKEYEGESRVKFLSHTVDPETDTPEVLKAYADERGINHAKWHFVTGNVDALYTMARKAYFIDDPTSPGYDEDFVHTENLALVDHNRHIRGYYNGIDSADVTRLIRDVRILLQDMD